MKHFVKGKDNLEEYEDNFYFYSEEDEEYECEKIEEEKRKDVWGIHKNGDINNDMQINEEKEEKFYKDKKKEKNNKKKRKGEKKESRK